MSDIDDILNSMFSGGRLSIGKAKQNSEEAEKALEGVQRINSAMSASLDERIKKLTDDAQKDLNDVSARLEKDGLIDEPVKLKSAENKDLAFSEKVANAFEKAEKSVAEKVLGQEIFISSVSLALKRPFVMGGEAGMPRSKAVLLGKNGTGKHETLETFVEELHRYGALTNGEVTYIDLSKYSDTSSEKTFIQDLYSASTKSTKVIAFENFERCHTSVLSLVSSLFTNGSVPLRGRYAKQKAGLVDIGTALVENVISEIKVPDKYLFLITEKTEKKLVDVFGMPFLMSCDDICKTSDFTAEILNAISDFKLKEFCTSLKNQYNFEASYDKAEIEILASKFDSAAGVESLEDYLARLKNQIGEYKLKNHGAKGESKLVAHEGELAFAKDSELIKVQKVSSASEGAVQEVKEELDSIIGLKFIKEYILSLEDNFKIQQLRRQKGLKTESPSMHMIFTGNPGTGKTTIARIVSRYLKAIGVLSGGQLIEVTRADLVGRYVGHTAPLTQKAIESALGGVLFIDEAYSLYRGGDDSFGLECIDTLVKGMEDNRENLLVILAGYSNEMEEFLTANSGLKSRFPNIVEFPDYTAQELVDIAKNIVSSKGYTLGPGCDEALYVYFDIAQTTGDPRTNGNGRMARNLVEEAILNCSKRNIKLPESEMNLELLLVEDFDLKDEK